MKIKLFHNDERKSCTVFAIHIAYILMALKIKCHDNATVL